MPDNTTPPAQVPLDQPIKIDLELPLEGGSGERLRDPDSGRFVAKEDGNEKGQETLQQEARKESQGTDQEKETADLKKQLEDLKRSEELARNAAQQAIAQQQQAVALARQREGELKTRQGEVEQAQYDAVLNAIGASQADSETAERDYESARLNGDIKGEVAAQRRLAAAVARLAQLEDGKAAFEAQRQTKSEQPPQRQEQPQQQRQPPNMDAVIDQMQLLDKEKSWLKEHKDLLTHGPKNEAMVRAHHVAMDKGLSRGSDEYFQFLEERVGLRQNAQQQTTTTTRRAPVSAPVSRDAPSMANGKTTRTSVTLSPEQREAARLSGIDEKTYAENLLKLDQFKEQGHYGRS